MAESGWDIDGIVKAYFGECTGEPFSDRQEEWQQWQRFLDMLCAAALFLKEQDREESAQRIGGLLSDRELMMVLEPHEKAEFEGRKKFRQVFELLLAKEPAVAGDRGEQGFLPFAGFLKSGMLSYGEILAFLMAAAVDLNRKYERVFGVLQEETRPMAKPALGLVWDLCTLFLEEEDGYQEQLWDEDSFLYRFLLEPWTERSDMSRLSRPLSLNRRVVQILAGEPMQMGCLSRYATVLEGGEDMEEILYNEEQFEELVQVFSTMTGRQSGGIIHLCAMEGIGKKFLMKSLASVAEMDVLCVDMSCLLAQDDGAVYSVLRDIVLKCIYEKSLLYLDKVSFEPSRLPEVQRIFAFLQDYINLYFVGSQGQKPQNLSVRGSWYTISLDIPGTAVQKRFWNYFGERLGLRFGEDVDVEQLVSRYHMTPGRISQVLECAVLDAEIDGHGFVASEQLLERQIRMKCSAEFGEYATRLESPFTWEDLQLSDSSRKLLNEACDRVRYRSMVNDTFGFGRKLPYGNGTSIVLYGPPGTGKTMAAQVFAKVLGLDIYRIDLSQIGSKYIGETEKNLGAVFQAAKFSNAVLFFDEADALFTKRTEVSNSNDKYANAQTAYLLQKIEEYSGVSILATNVMQNFDSAFKRRMTFMIPVEQPDEKTRLLLWQKAFPKETPLEEDIDFTVFARKAELTGSSIKSAAVAAAYRAAAGHRKIRNQDMVEAIDFEYRRTGRMGIGNELYEELYMRAGRDN